MSIFEAPMLQVPTNSEQLRCHVPAVLCSVREPSPRRRSSPAGRPILVATTSASKRIGSPSPSSLERGSAAAFWISSRGGRRLQCCEYNNGKLTWCASKADYLSRSLRHLVYEASNARTIRHEEQG